MNNLLCVNWEAIGAIGTAIGSIATAIAVIVAIVQLKAPTKKVIEVFSASAIRANDRGLKETYLYVDIKNKGNRAVELRQIYLIIGKEKYFLEQSTIKEVRFPQVVNVESMVTVYFPFQIVDEQIRQRIANKELTPKDKMYFLVCDSLGCEHKGNKIGLKKWFKE